jgi:ankyrin repeat protein
MLPAILMCLSACAKLPAQKASPGSARNVLKLRGYDFDEKSLYTAIENGDQFAIATFVDAGFDLNKHRDSDGQTPLIYAARLGKTEVVKALLDAKADVNARDHSDQTALSRALIERHDDTFELLLNRPGVDVNVKGLNEATPLITCVARSWAPAVQKLVDSGADINAQDSDGDTALHVAATINNEQIFKLLLDKGALVDVKNKVGGTALMWAASYDDEPAVRALVAHGASLDLKDSDGLTALGWAKKNNRAVAKVLDELASSKRKA